MFVTIFVEIYGKPGRKTLLTRPVPSILKYLTSKKWHRFSESFHLFETPKRSVKIKKLLFSPLLPL